MVIEKSTICRGRLPSSESLNSKVDGQLQNFQKPGDDCEYVEMDEHFLAVL